MAMFSASEKSSTSPRRWRSSAMWPTPAAERPAHARAGDVAVADPDAPAGRDPQPGDRLHELGLAVAVDAGDADDLARRAPRARRRAARAARGRPSPRGPPPRAAGSPVSAASLSSRNSTSRPTISLARLASVAPLVSTVPTFLPRRSTVTRSAISSTSRSLWEMKMTDDALRGERAQDLEQVGRLLGGEHGGRLVEDQDVRAAVQRAQDLHALLLADADVLHAGARVDGQPEAVRQLAHAPLGGRRRRAARPCAARRRARRSRPPS